MVKSVLTLVSFAVFNAIAVTLVAILLVFVLIAVAWSVVIPVLAVFTKCSS